MRMTSLRITAVRAALAGLPAALTAAGRAPEIMNADQGAGFSSQEWIGGVQPSGARDRQDGRGRALGNVMVERLWRSVKYEEVYLRERATLPRNRPGW